ncbi:glycosyl hydrolase [Paenibacillus lemnae]|uniref:glucan endo-1,3-beta-D-glucosidase n=1 Tax=Paenibacillus lemnae TaxID=1330551 RepID=A0A848MAM1_PAELE|nr:glycosyl hydrolase [Paenibacillus lemnae]NMO96514.1 glycoside hydrolase family 81 [Paenibacillus lemnae]
MKSKFWLSTALIGTLTVFAAAPAAAYTGEVKTGSGSYTTVMPPAALPISSSPYITENVKGPLPTSQWWSSLAWDSYSEAQYPHPLAVKHEEQGMRIYNPGPNLTNDKSVIDGTLPAEGDFIAGHSGAKTFPDARTDGFSDWFVNAHYENNEHAMNIRYGHGSPYLFFTYSGGGPSLNFASPPEIWYGNENSSVLGITAGKSHYALFAPSGSTWEGTGTSQLLSDLNGKTYFSIAVLPDNQPQTLEKYQQYAYSHIVDTEISWTYDEQTSEIHTTFKYVTEPKEGTRRGTLFAMYPHQWKHSSDAKLPYEYRSVRGTMKTGEGSKFSTSMTYTGILPYLPANESHTSDQMLNYVEEAAGELYIGAAETYSAGKQLGKLASLIPIAEQSGKMEAETYFRGELKTRLEDWLTSSEETGSLNMSQLFYYDRNWSTLIGYPAGYGSDTELNDHHIHYGYFVKAAAEMVRHDPSWGNDERFGPMVELLIRDMANPDKSDNQFPFLRHFDVFAGHSWSSGTARHGSGNYSGASGESMNAWSSIILWGEATGNSTLRDLGIYLYTTEMNAIKEYWFDQGGTNFPEDFTPAGAATIWGGKTEGDSTLYSSNPLEVQAVNWLPITGSSLYLTHSPALAEQHYKELLQSQEDMDSSAWPDLLYMYRAIAAPKNALSGFDQQAPLFIPEPGNSKAAAYAWISALESLGNQDESITANTTFYAVFDKNEQKSYVVYNMSDEVITVSFSDGTTLLAKPKDFTIKKSS